MMAAALFAVLATLAMNSTGLYHFAAIANPKGQILRIAAVMVAVFLLLMAAAVAFDVPGMFSLSWGLLWIAATVGVLVLCRTLVARFIRTLARTGRLGRRILIYGATDQARKLIERIERLGEPWNHIIGVFDDRISRVGPTVGRYPVMGDLDDLIAWGRENRLDEVLVALPWSAEARLLEVTRLLGVLPANVRLCPELLHDELPPWTRSHHFACRCGMRSKTTGGLGRHRQAHLRHGVLRHHPVGGYAAVPAAGVAHQARDSRPRPFQAETVRVQRRGDRSLQIPQHEAGARRSGRS
jgi:hypothetical protein